MTDPTSPARPGALLAGHLDEHAAEILYGAVLAGAAMAVVSVRPAGSGTISLSIVLMLVVYSLAHLYATVIGSRRPRPGTTVWARVRADLPHEAAVLEGGTPVLLFFLVLRGAGVGAPDAAWAASWFAVALLAVIGHRIAGRPARRACPWPWRSSGRLP